MQVENPQELKGAGVRDESECTEPLKDRHIKDESLSGSMYIVEQYLFINQILVIKVLLNLQQTVDLTMQKCSIQKNVLMWVQSKVAEAGPNKIMPYHTSKRRKRHGVFTENSTEN